MMMWLLHSMLLLLIMFVWWKRPFQSLFWKLTSWTRNEIDLTLKRACSSYGKPWQTSSLVSALPTSLILAAPGLAIDQNLAVRERYNDIWHSHPFQQSFLLEQIMLKRKMDFSKTIVLFTICCFPTASINQFRGWTKRFLQRSKMFKPSLPYGNSIDFTVDLGNFYMTLPCSIVQWSLTDEQQPRMPGTPTKDQHMIVLLTLSEWDGGYYTWNH